MCCRSSGLALMAPGGRPPLVRLPSVIAAGRDMPSLLTSVAGPSVDFSAASDDVDSALPMVVGLQVAAAALGRPVWPQLPGRPPMCASSTHSSQRQVDAEILS